MAKRPPGLRRGRCHNDQHVSLCCAVLQAALDAANSDSARLRFETDMLRQQVEWQQQQLLQPLPSRPAESQKQVGGLQGTALLGSWPFSEVSLWQISVVAPTVAVSSDIGSSAAQVRFLLSLLLPCRSSAKEQNCIDNKTATAFLPTSAKASGKASGIYVAVSPPAGASSQSSHSGGTVRGRGSFGCHCTPATSPCAAPAHQTAARWDPALIAPAQALAMAC